MRHGRVLVLPVAMVMGLAGCQPGTSGVLPLPGSAPRTDPIGSAAFGGNAAEAVPGAANRTIASLPRGPRVSVALKDGADAARFARRMAARGFKVRKMDGPLGLAAIEGASQADMAADPAVAGAWVDNPRPRVKPVRLATQTTLPPPDSLEELQWGLEAVKAKQAWQAGATGKGVQVAVLDTGIDPDNPDLAGNVDFEHSRSLIPEEDLIDLNGHGSHVAGIIGAARNGFGVVGVAPEATIVAVKVLDQYAYGDDFTILQGVRYAADLGADVINMSIETRLPWGSPEAGQAAFAFDRAVRYAARRGSLVVAGAGNDAEEERGSGWTHLPAAANWVLGVSAIGPVAQQGFLGFAIYSNYGRSLVDVAAPGGGLGFDPASGPYIADPRDLVLSTWSTHALPHVVAGVPVGPAPWNYFAGTSMACAFASGVAALANGARGDRGAALASRVSRTASGTGFNPWLGSGVVDAHKAVTSP